jgi:hypothetical protein
MGTVLPSDVAKKALAVQMLGESEGAQGRAGRALHRDVAPGLSAAILELNLLQREPASALALATPVALERALSALAGSVAALRTIELSLRPPLLEEAGLGPPLRWLADREGAAVTMPERLPRLDRALEWQLFQAVATLVRRGLRGRRRIFVSGRPLLVRLEGRPTARLPRALAEARVRLAGRARVVAGASLEIRLKASE